MDELVRDVLADDEAWFVGGAVRDELLGRRVVDVDVVCRDPASAARADFPGYGSIEQVGAAPALQAQSMGASDAGIAGFYDNGKSARAGADAAGRLVGERLKRFLLGDVFLVEANPEKYVERGRLNQPDRSHASAWPHPVIANGKLYLRDQDLLFCYNVKAN